MQTPKDLQKSSPGTGMQSQKHTKSLSRDPLLAEKLSWSGAPASFSPCWLDSFWTVLPLEVSL